MKRFLWLPVLVAVLLVASAAPAIIIPQPGQLQYNKDVPARIPDLDQNRDYTGDGNAETKWCAPTAAANSVWYFGKKNWPELIPAGANDTARADALITALGGLMGTNDLAGGTTIAGTVAGLQQYFINNTATPFTVTWSHAWTFPTAAGAPSVVNLWNWMTTELLASEDVLPILWMPGANGQMPVPPTDDSQVVVTPLDSISGHLVTQTAYNLAGYPGSITVHDPDDAAVGTGHVFPPVGAGPPGKVTYNLTIVGPGQGTALWLTNPAGSLHNALIVGAISASPVPEPSMLLLVGPALGALLLRMRRKKS
jgi:hypothetical protein